MASLLTLIELMFSSSALLEWTKRRHEELQIRRLFGYLSQLNADHNHPEADPPPPIGLPNSTGEPGLCCTSATWRPINITITRRRPTVGSAERWASVRCAGAPAWSAEPARTHLGEQTVQGVRQVRVVVVADGTRPAPREGGRRGHGGSKVLLLLEDKLLDGCGRWLLLWWWLLLLLLTRHGRLVGTWRGWRRSEARLGRLARLEVLLVKGGGGDQTRGRGRCGAGGVGRGADGTGAGGARGGRRRAGRLVT